MSTMQVMQRARAVSPTRPLKPTPIDAFKAPPPEFPLLCVRKGSREARLRAEARERQLRASESNALLDAEQQAWAARLTRAKAALAAEEAEWRLLRERAAFAIQASEERERQQQIARARAAA